MGEKGEDSEVYVRRRKGGGGGEERRGGQVFIQWQIQPNFDGKLTSSLKALLYALILLLKWMTFCSKSIKYYHTTFYSKSIKYYYLTLPVTSFTSSIALCEKSLVDQGGLSLFYFIVIHIIFPCLCMDITLAGRSTSFQLLITYCHYDYKEIHKVTSKWVEPSSQWVF